MGKYFDTPISSRVIFSLFIVLILVAVIRAFGNLSGGCICQIPIPQDYYNYLIYRNNCQCEYIELSQVIFQYLALIILPFVLSFSVLTYIEQVDDSPESK